ncbi:hypothetical protein FDECE_13267 [Fusarium decemcellulare]|nr:hypothetical protein FDECE_13267 [Fusarium decemcellulare]
MITISEPLKPMEANIQDRPSSLGILDRLPAELLHGVLSELDFRSMTRFSRGSIRARNMLQSLPAYRDLMNHAPQAVAALGQTKLIHLHSASELLAALRTECCATCLEYGAYLFLPTCERCCWQCLRSNLTRRVISPTAAGRIFALLPKMVQQLPVMFSIPGAYGVARKPAQAPHKLVSVSAAKKLAMSIHGSVVNLIEVSVRRKSTGPTAYTTRYLEAAFLDSTTDSDPLMMPDQGGIGVDPYFGMASIPFPSLPTPDVVDTGLWCKGCEWMYERQKSRQLPAHVIANTVPVACDPDRVLLGLARRARSRMGFLGHIRSCYGARQLLANEGVEEH